jgi:hypothetical protein
MASNVWEWVAHWYDANYYQSVPRNRVGFIVWDVDGFVFWPDFRPTKYGNLIKSWRVVSRSYGLTIPPQKMGL